MTRNRTILSLWVLLLVVSCLIRCTQPTSFGKLSASANEYFASQNGDTLKVVISSNQDWTALTDEPWLQPNILQGVANGRVKLTIRVHPNLTDEERIGTVKIATESDTIRIRVQQQHGDVDAEKYQYDIPVIFHVLYNKAYENDLIADNNPAEDIEYFPLNSSTLQVIIEEVNKIYEGMPAEPQEWGFFRHFDYGQRPFRNINLKFSLATKDPSGKTLTPIGIVRHEVSDREIDPAQVMQDKEGGVYHNMAYPVTDYVNVFVFPFATQGDDNYITLGIAHLPYGTKANPIPGLNNLDVRYSKFKNYNHCAVINAKVFEPRLQLRLPLQKRAPINTIAHELGHIVGLYHVFSEKRDENGVLTNEQNTCEDTDFCEDTPSYNRQAYEQQYRLILGSGRDALTIDQMTGLLNRFTCANQNRVSTNVMDYDWTYGDRFEPQQKKRIRQVLYYSFCIPGLKMAEPSPQTRAIQDPVPIVSSCSTRLLK